MTEPFLAHDVRGGLFNNIRSMLIMKISNTNTHLYSRKIYFVGMMPYDDETPLCIS